MSTKNNYYKLIRVKFEKTVYPIVTEIKSSGILDPIPDSYSISNSEEILSTTSANFLTPNSNPMTKLRQWHIYVVHNYFSKISTLKLITATSYLHVIYDFICFFF